MWEFVMMQGINTVRLVNSDIVVWNCDENVEYITLEGVHKNICGDFFIRKEGEKYAIFQLLIIASLLYPVVMTKSLL